MCVCVCEKERLGKRTYTEKGRVYRGVEAMNE